MDRTITRFPNGVSTAAESALFADFPAPNPLRLHTYFNDFDTYVAGDWTITSVDGGGDSGEVYALADLDGGVFSVTTNDADNDAEFFNKDGESFLFESGKKLWFAARFKVDDATQSDLVFGLQITDTSPLDVTDGVFFQKDDGDTNIDFHVEKNNTATSSTAVTTIADDTFIALGFYYDGDSAIYVYVNDVLTTKVATTNLPDDEVLAVSFGVQAGEAATKTLSVDYIFAAKER